MGDISAHRLSDNRSLRLIPTDALVIAVTLRPQERPQTKPDVVAPRAARAHLRPLDQTELLEAAMIVFNRPRVARPLDPLQIAHLNFIRRPHLNVAVCGDRLEDADQTEPFKPHHTSRLADLDFADSTQAFALRVHFAVTLEPGQPNPAERADQLQVLKAGVPTIERDAGRRKASRMRLSEHRLKVVVLRQRIPLLVEDA